MKTIVLTGATRGLGRALVTEFVSDGHRVAGCGRSADLVKELAAAHSSPHRFDPVDVADDVAVKGWAERVLESHGPPDLLINNAAIINHPANLWEIPAETFDPIVDVNIKGVTNVIRHFVPAMVRRGEGVIVNLSSGWGRSTSSGMAPYCATKYAVEGLSAALADDLPRGLAAVALNPGVIHTGMLEICFGESSARAYPSPTEWARSAAPYLLSLGPRDNGRALTAPG